MDRGVVGDPRPDRVPGAAIDEVIVAQGQDPAVVVEAHFDIVQLVARMGGAHQVLAAAFDPAHRAPEPAGEKRDQQVFGVDMALAAKAAADVERDAPHPRLGQTQQRSGFAAHPVHHLGRGPDRHRLGARIIGGDDPAALHRHRRIAMMVKAAFEPVRRCGQHRVGLAPPDRKGPHEVGLEPVVDDRAVRPQRRFGIDHRRQFFEVQPDRFGRVLGLVAGLGDDDRDRLADMAHLVVRQERLLRIEEFVLDDRGPFARHRDLALGHRRQQLQQIGAIERQHDAGHRGGARKVDRADAGMRRRAAHQHRVQHARQHQIGDELPLAGQKPAVFAPQERAPDKRECGVAHR